MEEILRRLQKEASGHKHKALRDACVCACETLELQNGTGKVPPSKLRERCLLPLQMALESKSSKLGQTALTGMQKVLCDERLVAGLGLEVDMLEKQLLAQMLDALRVTPGLHEDLQVEVMKVLLCITYSPNFDLNGDSILRIAQVCLETYEASGHQRSINTAVRATLSQILGDMVLQLRSRQEGADGEEVTPPLHRKDVSPTSLALCEDVVTVLTVFCEKLESVHSENPLLLLLYLECILSMLSSCPPTMHLSRGFTDLVWKQLCPSLVAIMGNPVNDKTITSHHSHMGALERDRATLGVGLELDPCLGGVSDQGRGSGCSSSAPSITAPVVRTVCYIAAELVRLVSCVESMKPVLQSLYHRILLYPPPQHRTEAIRIMKEILGSPQRLLDLAGPCVAEPDTRKRSFSKRKSHLDMLRLVMDGMSEACLKGGVEACFSSVSCVCALLVALEELSQGRGLQLEQARLLLRRLDDLKEGTESTRESMEINEADFRWQRHVLSAQPAPWPSQVSPEPSPDISISITTESGHTTLGLEEQSPGAEECGEEVRIPSPTSCSGQEEESRRQMTPRADASRGLEERPPGGPAPPDVLQRSHGIVYPDITNFLSVESRGRPYHGTGSARYSESNFSMEEQELSRTELDSCDQYSMAAEKDSGRSDVSDMGSDNVSLADEDEQTPRDCPGHRSLRTAALSLRLLRHQEADQHSARLFLQSLRALLPRLLALPTTAEVDTSLQNFSSTFCSGLQAGGVQSPGLDPEDPLSCQSLMNADGLYLVSYSALLLNLRLLCADHYRRRGQTALLSLKEFSGLLQSSGVLVVLSQAWIEELYQQVLEHNLLAEAGYYGSPEDHRPPLITMLIDMDGLGSSAIGGQLIRRSSVQSPLTCEKSSSDLVTAGSVFARFLLSGVWRNLMEVLSAPLTGRMAGSSRGLAFILGSEGREENRHRERDAICLSLDGLRKAAGLSCALGVAAHCASALAQMAAASCVQEEREDKEQLEPGDTITQVKQRVEQRLEQMRAPGVRLHTAHVLCMDAILTVGLEMGSHNHDCWPHIFRVTEYVSSLERSHFSDGSQPSSLTTITQSHHSSVDQGLELTTEPSTDPSELGLSQPVIQPLSIQELLKEGVRGKGLELRGGSLLTGSSAAKAVCTLSTQADRLFEEASMQLNLVALVGFLQQLRKASQAQLFSSVTDTGDYSLAMPGEARATQERALHLFRLGECMLRIVRNKRRPLLHMMRAWSVVAPHLVEAACHKERHVSQRSVSFIHAVLTEVLSSWAELPHFHFNEALFRPLEHVMQLELCDEDVQDQVVTSIAELVEMCSPQILSGWRPLFSALRTVHSSKSDTKDYLLGEYSMGKSQAPVFDVFEAFINTDNIQVFANAATDYIMCLMKFVKGLGEVDYKEIGDCVNSSAFSSTDLCLPALDYLHRCSQLLSKIYKMASKPVFVGARLSSLPLRGGARSVSSDDGLDCVLQEFDDDSGLVQVWILLLEQLTAAVSTCPRQHQPPTLELLFTLLRELTHVPGPGFALFAVIQLLLPVMSLWLQRSHGDHAYWDMAAANFKHAIGLCCELVVEHVHSFIHSGYHNGAKMPNKLKGSVSRRTEQRVVEEDALSQGSNASSTSNMEDEPKIGSGDGANFDLILKELREFRRENKEQFDNIREDINGIAKRMDEAEEQIMEAETSIQASEEMLLELAKLQTQVEAKLTDLEGRSRRENIRIHGVVEGAEEGATSVINFVESLLRNGLGIPPTTAFNIERAHRALGVKPPVGAPPRSFVVKFAGYRLKEDILRRAWQARGFDFQGKKVFLDNDYAPEIQKRRKEYTAAKAALREKNIRFQTPFPARLRVHYSEGMVTYNSAQEATEDMVKRDMGYESLINLMLKELFKLLVSCVSEPAEPISRVGCSCIRYVLVTVGPVFTEEMWRLACCALQDAFSATLEPVKNLLSCFHSSADSSSADACEVKVAAPSHCPSAEAEYWRIKAMAQQVFMLDSQCSPKTPSNKEGFEHAQSCVLIIEVPAEPPLTGHAHKRIPFRSIVVSLLSHQVLLQNLSDILLQEFVKQPEGQERVTPVTSDPSSAPAGFLRYISIPNLNIILDLLLDSYRTARDFDARPGLKYLLMKVSGVCAAANLYRQSAMSFTLYLQALLGAILSQADCISAHQVKKILYEEEEGSSDSSHPNSASSEDEDIFEETAQVSPPRGRDKRGPWRAHEASLSVQPVGVADWAWLVKRLYKLCMDLCSSYIQMHRDLECALEERSGLGTEQLLFLPLFHSGSSTPSSVGGFSARGTPSEEYGYRGHTGDTSTSSPGDTPTPSPGFSGSLPHHFRSSSESREPGAGVGPSGGATAGPGVGSSVGPGRRKEWWESAGNKLYTMATDRTLSKLMLEYKRRKQQPQQQQSHLNLFMKEQGRTTDKRGPAEPPRPLQRPQHLLEQQPGPPLRHSVSAGPEVLRQDKRPRSGSTVSCHTVSLRDAEAQIQAWTNMVLSLLEHVLLLSSASFLALQPALFPCLSQLSCHVSDPRVRQALREWLDRVGRLYHITTPRCPEAKTVE
uniref:SEC7 domain-containing protein n=1 Tax=Knipowitschia caucasica TaxID=637954 RepID=A0AAV2JPJ8_KNICA